MLYSLISSLLSLLFAASGRRTPLQPTLQPPLPRRARARLCWNETVTIMGTDNELPLNNGAKVQCGCRCGGRRCTAFTDAGTRICHSTYYVPMNVTPVQCGEICEACWQEGDQQHCHGQEGACSGKHRRSDTDPEPADPEPAADLADLSAPDPEK